MPTSQKAKEKLNAKRYEDDKPRKDDPFTDGCTWAEFNLHEVDHNKDQVKVDLSKENQIWYYLGKTSTDAKAQYTEDPTKRRHNPKGNYLSTIPKPPKPAPVGPSKRKPQLPQQGPSPHVYQNPTANTTGMQAARVEKPYMYKPRQGFDPSFNSPASFTVQRFAPTGSSSPAPQTPPTQFNQYLSPGQSSSGYQTTPSFSTQRFEVRQPQQQTGYPGQSSSPYQGNQQHAQGNWNTHVQSREAHDNCHYSQPASAPTQASPRPAPAPAPSAPPAPVQHRQPSKFTWQVHPSIYQKYQFFQVHHNR
jgi:hypothetical protein